jgi:hypothetical protein
MGSIEYRFNRRTKQLAIGAQGEPGLLVKDNQLFLLLWHDKNEEVPPNVRVFKKEELKQEEILGKQKEHFSAIFDLGNPDYKHILVPQEQNTDKIDPKNRPVCIKTDAEASSWRFSIV